MPSYFCTVLGGLEKFCMEEVRAKLTAVAHVTQIQGRVFWTSDPFDTSLLHSCERIFYNCTYKPHSIKSPSNAKAFIERAVREVNWKEMLAWNRIEGDSNTPAVAAVKFRVQAKIRGSLKRFLHFTTVKQMVADLLEETANLPLTYEEDRSQCDIEIFLHWNDERLVIGIPITFEHSYMPNPGIRRTLAWSMGHLSRIKAGYTVMDPCAGKGTTVVEAVMAHSDVTGILIDSDSGQLKECEVNVESLPAAKRAQISLLQGSCRSLSLKSDSVDVVLCDPPFGILHKVKGQTAANQKQAMEQFYGDLLTELSRVVKAEGVCVILISNVTFLEHAQWDIFGVHPVRHGKLNASLVVLRQVQQAKKKRIL